jgi:hypothetical protein
MKHNPLSVRGPSYDTIVALDKPFYNTWWEADITGETSDALSEAVGARICHYAPAVLQALTNFVCFAQAVTAARKTPEV